MEMDFKEVLEYFECTIYDGELQIKDKNNNVQHYSNTSLVYSDKDFLKTYYINSQTPQQVFIYYDFLSFLTDYNKSIQSKFNNSMIVICTINSLHKFLDHIPMDEKKELVHFFYPLPKDFNFNAVYIFLSLNRESDFSISEKNGEYIIIKNEKYIYSFNKNNYSFNKLKSALRLKTRSLKIIPFYKNNIQSDNFIIF